MNTALLCALCVLLPYAVADYTIDKVAVGEGDGTVQFTISFNPTGNWFIQVETEDISATEGSDYEALDPILYNGLQAVTSVTVSVTITDDTIYESSPETFKIKITTANEISDAFTSFTITINENDVINVDVGVDSVKMLEEYVGNVDVIFKRLDSTTHAFSFDYSFEDGTATVSTDLTAAAGTVSFSQNEMTKTKPAMFAVVDDKDDEGDEGFTLALTGSEINAIDVVYTIKDNDAVINVHCLRPGQACENSASCDTQAGSCTCVDGTTTGALCEITTADVNGAGCPQDCGANGQCIGGAAPACKCNPDWVGDKCQYKAYYAQCNANNFGICISPYNLAMFSGDIYIKGQEATPACHLSLITTQTTGVPDWCNGYGAMIPYLSGPCGQPTTNPAPVDGMTKYEVVFRVQYDAASKQSTDEIVTLVCQYDATGTFVVPGGVFALSSDSIDQSGSPNGGTTDFSPASQSLVANDGSPLTDTVEIGARIKVCVTVNGVDAFGSVKILNIVLDNNIQDTTDSNYKSVEIFAAGCKSSHNYLVVMPFFDPNNNKHTVCYEIQAIAFKDDKRPEKFLRIQTEVQGFSGLNDATMDTCVTRRKRQANKNNSTAELQTVIKLVLPKAVQLQGTDSACAREWLMPAMIGVSIISITMAVIIIILVFTVVKKFRTKEMA